MPVSLAQLARNSAKITFQIGDDPDQMLTIEYYSRRMTNTMLFTFLDLQHLREVGVAEARKSVLEIDQTLADLIKDWDFYEDNDFTIKAPITKERMAEIDWNIRGDILLAIGRDARGPEV